MASEDDPHFHGHRARLRKRFLEGGSDALADYELLELILLLGHLWIPSALALTST